MKQLPHCKRTIKLLLCCLLSTAWTSSAFGQCDKVSENYGQFVVKATKCAPVDFRWELRYEVQSGAAVQFYVEWDDGSSSIITPTPQASTNPGFTNYVEIVNHIYPKNGDKCQYEPKAYPLVNGVQCFGSEQSLKVTVWDIDSENGGIPRINPLLYRVCLGESATVTFNDNSTWNCVPASGENDRKNNYGRWVQWVYGVGAISNRIPGVEVNGTSALYPFDGAVEYEKGPIENPFSTSYDVYIPPTSDPNDIGKEFVIELRNWNLCNPYDADTLDGNPLNPINGSPTGDSMYIYTPAKIVIVDKADPDFRTRKDNSSGLITTEFCAGEKVYFQNITASIPDAAFLYDWKIYDDEFGTVLAKNSTNKNTTFTFSTKGRKKIQLTVKDNNSVGKCGGTIVKYIDIVSAADAKISVTDEYNQPLNDLCYSTTNNSFKIKFTDVSSDFDPVNSKWQWDFYHFDGASYVWDSKEKGAVTQQSFIKTYTVAGSYMVVLTDSANNVECFTQDTAYVHIYQKPVANFTASTVCQGDSTNFTSTATLPKIVNNDFINLYEWDLHYDGITFSPEVTATSGAAFKYKFSIAGTYKVAHRVTTFKGRCSDIIIKDVVVKPSPYVSFQADQVGGCSPLTVTFTVDTLLANQPVQVTSYIWHIKDLKTGIDNPITVTPADTFVAPEFINTQTSLINHQYEVWLEANAANACSAVSDKKIITIYPGPSSEFIITNLTGADNNCAPRKYQFQVAAATQALNPNHYQWTIIDKSDNSTVVDTSLPGANPDFEYTLHNTGNTAKKFKVRLLARHNSMCFSATEKIVTVNPLPSSEFTTTEIGADCQLVTYQVEAKQKGLIYQWTVDPLPLNNPDYSQEQLELVYRKKFGSTSNVKIELKSANLVGCESIVTKENITVDPQEVIDASFIVSPSILEIPNRTVSIMPNSTNANWTYQWDFGDGSISVTPNPGTHRYTTYGEYWIKVFVSGDHCYEEDSAKVIIKQTLPVVDFDYSQIEGCLPLTVFFYNETEFADTTTYWWDFGDGGTSTEPNPSYTYRTSGVYTISLKASNSLGIVVSKEKDLVIDLTQGPKADFNIRLAKSYLPDQDIIFSNQSQRVTSYHWDFGDGNTSKLKDPVHQYEETGHYDITLIVQNDLGCTDTLVKPIFIEPLVPEVDFTYEPPTGCRPLTVQFRNLTRYAEPGSYRWSFGEGQGVSTEENPTYTYYEPGIYTITLEASNSIGVTATEKKEFSVEVYDNPIAAFNLRPDKVFLGEDIYLVNLSLAAKSYIWDFGDGNISTDFEPVHRYEAPGTYDISLMVANEHGCTDTLKKVSAVIIEKGGKIQIPNAFTPSTFGPGGSDASSSDKNNVFLPIFEGVTSFHMMIYNRWGELLFESFDKGYGWDGYYKGKLCTKDVYVYKLELKFSDGRSDTAVGDVTLIR